MPYGGIRRSFIHSFIRPSLARPSRVGELFVSLNPLSSLSSVEGCDARRRESFIDGRTSARGEKVLSELYSVLCALNWTLQADPSGREPRLGWFAFLRSTIFPTCPVPSTKFHQPRQNGAGSGTLKIQVYPTEVRDQMDHAPCIRVESVNIPLSSPFAPPSCTYPGRGRSNSALRRRPSLRGRRSVRSSSAPPPPRQSAFESGCKRTKS